ncbi:nitronate monooxygenase [Saccharopolyspora shandongensis]|uniref:NAD(P)H-dependent flavin oxidoreductase n=1 Tax=Saccharopolyspora shandongensis TaxID=418495 RepID=UPI003436BCB1
MFDLENHPTSRSLGSRYPIFGLSHNLDVVAAICNAGGIGMWAAARLLPEEIVEQSRMLRESVGDKPFGINLMLPTKVPPVQDRAAVEVGIPEEHKAFVARLYAKYGVPDDGLIGERNRIVRSDELFDNQIEAALQSSANLFAMAVGSRPSVPDRVRAAGMRLVALVGSPRHVPSALGLEPDFLVAQGYDAGGHTGQVGTFTLVPKIVEMAGEVPVLAAGGIGTGSQIAASLAMGAAGVWLGTVWLGTSEEHLPEALLGKVLRAGCEDTVITRCSSGKPMRQVKTAWAQEWAGEDAPVPLPMPWQDLLVGSLEGAAKRHGIEPLLYTPAGQSVEWVREVTPVAEVMNRLVSETSKAVAVLASATQ